MRRHAPRRRHRATAFSNAIVAPIATSGPTTRRPICGRAGDFQHAGAGPATGRARQSGSPRAAPRRRCRAARRRNGCESGRVHDLDFAARRCDRDAARGRLQFALAGKGRQENVMIGRIFGDHAPRPPTPRHAVGVVLKGRVPEILRKMLLADGKPMSGSPAGRAQRRARMPTFTGEPSGRLPSRSKRIAGEAAIPARKKLARLSPHPCFRGAAGEGPGVDRETRLNCAEQDSRSRRSPSLSGSATVSISMKKPGNCTR